MSANSALVSSTALRTPTATTSIPVIANCRGAGGIGTSTLRDLDHLMHILYTQLLTECKCREQNSCMKSSSRTRPVYTMSIAAELLDLPPATLRLYERKGLVDPARTDGGTRRYSADDIDRMRRIADLQTDGVNLAGIGKVMGLQDENAELKATLDGRTRE